MQTHFTKEKLAEGWTEVASFDNGELVAYRGNMGGLLRIIDTESGHDILELFGNPRTASIEDAEAKAKKLMTAQPGE